MNQIYFQYVRKRFYLVNRCERIGQRLVSSSSSRDSFIFLRQVKDIRFEDQSFCSGLDVLTNERFQRCCTIVQGVTFRKTLIISDGIGIAFCFLITLKNTIIPVGYIVRNLKLER